jgi:hypothetical protein
VVQVVDGRSAAFLVQEQPLTSYFTFFPAAFQVVKWMDVALQKRRREEHLAAMRQGLVPSMSMSECHIIFFNKFMMFYHIVYNSV